MTTAFANTLPQSGLTNYKSFLDSKRQLSGDFGFDPVFIPSEAFDFQQELLSFAVKKGRSAIFADCGLGKTLIQLAWAENVARKTGKPVLILTPLAVSHQTVAEAHKFNIDCQRSNIGEIPARIVVTNYERLHYFKPENFGGVVCDESSILKNFDGQIKSAITEFMRMIRYRLLCTATAAPNDFIELGTSSEALGELGFIDMLARFFKANNDAFAQGGGGGGRWSKDPFGGKFRFRGHAERDFWRWVCSWARAVRKPSDLGFDDGGFKITRLITRQHTVKARNPNPEFLFDMPAHGLKEQREERSRTLEERCEMASEIIAAHSDPCVAWCHLNCEGDLLKKLIPDSVQVSGKHSDEFKEESFRAFESGEIRVIVTKPTIAGFGLNWQHCAHQTFFPSHSFEQWYQAIRRCWRFGQKRPVTVDVISSEGESSVLANLYRKSAAAESMFAQLVALMRDELRIQSTEKHTIQTQLPPWLS